MKSVKSTAVATILGLSVLSTSVLAGIQPTKNIIVSPEKSTTISVQKADKVFEKPSVKSTQLVALSQTEMNETEGAWINFAIGAGFGTAFYVGKSYVTKTPMTWKGAGVAAASGALTGGVGGALIKQAGGGVAANIAWRPNMFAGNYSLNKIFNR